MIGAMQTISIDSNDFAEIRQSKFLYVDKTAWFHRLAKAEGRKMFFLARPRRFGKSLMLSTLKAMFEGRKDLFKGLKAYDLPRECWDKPYPVYSFTMAETNGMTYAEVEGQIGKLVRRLCRESKIPFPKDGNIPGKFDDFLKAAIAKSPTNDTYRLAPPNEEIRQSLRDGYISRILGFEAAPFDTLLDRAKRMIAVGDIREVVETMLFSLYAQVPPDWRIKDEAEAKRYFQLFFAMLGADPAPEFPSARGYADAIIQRPTAVFVVEFKYHCTAEEAIKQIRDMGYADKWRGGPRTVTLVGVNFNPVKRNIDIPIIEPL
jgi:hypothetical protein